mmetsp:Transcript_38688/g.84154  ORF Transcript_38688/g.84154 Transcript_38688/m.84154 type:complete len:97 (-) Transcript_38688:324-614(-)|eukprot:CAMPEP_0118934594 /NCGR_PEP_ID=MMETSP1169-20130426/13911_1 /TAXON_ID=36882 /ORGANISM="Pyramimonas obovata, Strain CCMP722" /LENGTH=96 /DNA_ID=CAMNT_0006877515 /DNA_START=158 /DNA_END=448 /DNA_ORIENTATION=+
MFNFALGGGQKKPAAAASAQKELIVKIKGWVAEAVDTSGAVVMVTELKCTDVGCPPFDTVMALLRDGGNDKRVLHCALSEVTLEEVKRVWSEKPES